MPPLADAAVQIAPLQIAPAIAFGVMYFVRARTLAARGSAGRVVAAVVLVRRPRDHRPHAVLAARLAVGRAVRGAHGRAPADRGHRRAGARARPDGPAARSAAARAGARLAARARASRAGVLAVGRRPAVLAPRRAARGRGPQRGRARAAAHAVRRPRDQHVDGAARPAAQARVVRQRREARLHRRRPAHFDGARERLRVDADRVLRRLRRGRARARASRRSQTRSSRARS